MYVGRHITFLNNAVGYAFVFDSVILNFLLFVVFIHGKKVKESLLRVLNVTFCFLPPPIVIGLLVVIFIRFT